MFNYRTWLPIAIVSIGLFTPTTNCMKSVDTQGVWTEFDTKPYTKKISTETFYFKFSPSGEFFCGGKGNIERPNCRITFETKKKCCMYGKSAMLSPR